ncbi:MAG: DUF4326 domain-containing protein [Candidatus Methanofastidiosa archaeon]|jgi:hypothetical protein|nr:DUF4326 domain-containing protein [Candidatus Methanofastidiosa archaeon]
MATIDGKMKVVHCKKEKYDVYIGRPSKWGNPFSHKEETLAQFKVNSRDEAVEAYRKWITEGDGKHLLNDLHELDGKILGCWCKPKACHGDVLIELIEKQKQKTLF